ncbi:MAG: TIGR01212 family radical SAM protein [Firmicutes bacterium]|nr:TIGR01212 family radical SAM protein [Bacillota bacterium]
MQERFNSINQYLRREFGRKTVKLSIEAGFTCPNRDGKVGFGGCAFCSSGGSGELASNIEDQIELLSQKWPNAEYLAYFQSHTNTYAPVEVLREKFYAALDDPRISGIAIATRPDCLGDDVLNLLDEINKEHFLWVELGLQTIHPSSSEMLGIGYDLAYYDKAVAELKSRNIRVVSHLILGLPGETREDMIASVKHVADSGIFGLKLHLLNIVSTARIYDMFPGYQPFESIDEYTDLVVDLLELIPWDITIHRLTGDVPREQLVAPEWSYRKRTILNEIGRKQRERDSWQGKAVD